MQHGISVAGTSLRPNGALLQLDVTKHGSVVQMLEKTAATCVINCAAATNVDECERHPSFASAVNAEGAGNVAEACKRTGVRLVHVSTDSVFDGSKERYSEESRPNPLNVYAKTKLEGEMRVSESPDHTIVRTNFYGFDPNGKHLLNWIITSLKQNREMIGFVDASFNPLWARDLAALLVELALSSFRGMIHCAGDEVFTKHEFIRRIVLGLGYGDSMLKEGSIEQAAFLAPRPKNTALANTKMHQLLKTKIQTLDEVLRDDSFDIHRAQNSQEV